VGGCDVELVLLEFMAHPENCVLFVPSVVQVEAGTEFGKQFAQKECFVCENRWNKGVDVCFSSTA
jgi:hypothetical protein